jgi:branched-chain amino acid transport system substrate-binding protein
MKRLTTLMTWSLVLCLLSGGLVFAGGQGETKDVDVEVIKIGAAVSLTGDLARFGTMVQQGYELWKETVNEQGGIQVGDRKLPVEIIYYDDQSDSSTAARLTERLIVDDGVQFLLGPYGSGPTFATTPIAERYNIITMATLANAPRIYERGFKNVFAVLAPGPWIFRSFIDMLSELDEPPSRVAVISPDDLFPSSVAEGAKAYAKEKGFEVVYTEIYPKGARDLSSPVLRIKDSKAEVLMGSGYLEEAILTMRLLGEQNVDLKAIGFTTGPELEDFRASLGEDAENVCGVSWWMPQMQYRDDVFGSASDYAEKFAQKYPDTEIAYQAAAASQGGLLLQKAIETAGTLETDAVREALRNFKGTTFWGRTEYDETGQNIAGGSVTFQIQDGKIETVYPADAATAEPRYPY